MEKDKFAHLKFRLPGIKTLAMLKMEKNFIALVEKYRPPERDMKLPVEAAR